MLTLQFPDCFTISISSSALFARPIRNLQWIFYQGWLLRKYSYDIAPLLLIYLLIYRDGHGLIRATLYKVIGAAPQVPHVPSPLQVVAPLTRLLMPEGSSSWGGCLLQTEAWSSLPHFLLQLSTQRLWGKNLCPVSSQGSEVLAPVQRWQPPHVDLSSSRRLVSGVS